MLCLRSVAFELTLCLALLLGPAPIPRCCARRPGDHLARSRDPLGRSAARDRRCAAKHDPIHLADQTGALVFSGGLQAALGTRHRRRLFQCQL